VPRPAIAAVRCPPVVTADDLAGFRAGEPDAVRAVYRDYGGLVFAVCLKALGRRDLAEEAAQQTFVKAWRAAGAFDTARELGPWLATIARRTAIDIHRRESRRPTSPLDDVAPADPNVVELPVGVERSYEVAEVRAAIDVLPPEEREIVRLQHLEELTHTEVAERLGVPVGTVKSRSFRAHKRLAGLLGHLREATG
jgi:RNA polymerase sigma factor (sigma-70 family)